MSPSTQHENARSRQVPGIWSAFLVAGLYAGLLWLERRRPLRRSVEPKLRRQARNLAVATVSALAVQIVERPLVAPLSRWVERRGFGLLKIIRLPVWLEVLLASILLDYTLYLWHVATHRLPWLWRFHQVHHVDLDMDVSTALRFHFGELSISTAWRAAQILSIGVCPLALSFWQTALLLEVMFHHSNVALPRGCERWLSRWIVTPRLHGIHHSARKDETNSNWSSGLTVWDMFHGTFREDPPQRAITVGVPAFQDPREVTLPRVLRMPFISQRDPWRAQ